MEVKDIDFSTKPKAYKLCFNDNCSFAEKCLRHIAVAKLEECSDLLQVVNHAKFNDKNCKYFVDCKKVCIAYGMKKAFENILVSDVEKIRNELIQLFGQTGFYRRRNAKKPLSPEEQVQIENIFAKFGYTITFDEIIETTFWKD